MEVHGAEALSFFKLESLFSNPQGGESMGAKNDLNEIYLSGSVVMAAFIGATAQSWGVFFTALIILVGIYLFTGKIR